MVGLRIIENFRGDLNCYEEKSSQCSNLSLLQLPQPPDGGPDAGRGHSGVVIGSSSNVDPAVLVVTEPHSNSLSLHLILSTERAQELTVLRDLHLLDGFPQAGSVPGPVLPGDPNLLGSFGHPEHLDFSCRSESSNISLV